MRAPARCCAGRFSIGLSRDGDGMRLKQISVGISVWVLSFALSACAQQASEPPPAGAVGTPMGQMKMDMPGMTTGGDFLQTILLHTTSGTSAEPNSTPAPMLMKQAGGWMLMFHYNVFL